MLVLVLAAAVKVIVALFEPVALLAVNHVWLLVMFQLVVEVMPKVAVLLAAAASVVTEVVSVSETSSNFDTPPP